MKGYKKFMSEAWWVFAAAGVTTLVMAWLTGWFFYLAFLPVLFVISVYMSVVRYDADGNHRGDKH